MKWILPKITGTIALFCLLFCIDSILYDLSSWGGGGFIDLAPAVITISGVAVVVFGIITGLLWYMVGRSAEERGYGAIKLCKSKENIKHILPIITGTIAFYGLIRFFLDLHDPILFTYSTNSTFLNFSIRIIFIIRCVFTVMFLVITVLLLIANRKK